MRPPLDHALPGGGPGRVPRCPAVGALSVVHQLREPAAPPGRRDRTRAALIRAGEQLMAERSVDAVSIDDIVATAGVAKGTFYNHFPDKESLQHEALELIRLDIKREIMRCNEHVEDPARRILRAFCVVLRYGRDHRQRGEFLTRTSMAFRVIDDRMNEGLVQDVAIGLSAGRFPIATTESGALLMLGIVQAAMVRALDGDGAFSLASRAQQLGGMLLRGLGLERDEAEAIASQEADHIILGHEFKRD